jgi:hypothetical protein
MPEDISLLNEIELEDFKKWVQTKRDHYERLLNKIISAQSNRGQKELNLDQNGSEGKSTREAIFHVIQQSEKWLCSLDIRKLLQDKYSIRITGNGLRRYLREGEGKYFKRRGKAKFTEWKTINSSEN